MIKTLKTIQEATAKRPLILLVEWNAERWVWKGIVLPMQSLAMVAYYKASQMMGYDRVPESMFCPEGIGLEHGTLQKYIDGIQPSAGHPVSSLVAPEEVYNMATFDFMMNLLDRNLNTIAANGKLWAIDNESMYWLPICGEGIRHLLGRPLPESMRAIVERALGSHAAVIAMIENVRYPWGDTTEQQKDLLRKIAHYVGGRITLLSAILRKAAK